MASGVGRPIKPILYIEGKRIDNALITATCNASIGSPSTAVISLTPTDTIRRILPRTYVHLFVNDPWNADSSDPVLLFEGEVLGMGFVKNDDGRSFIIHCADVSNYWHHVRQYWFNLTQGGGNFLDEFIRMTTGGAAKVATTGSFGIKGYIVQKLNMISDQENKFLDNMIGLLDDIGNISAFYQNARRRLRITDRVLRKNAGSVQNLLNLSFFSDWVQQLASARSGETNLLSLVSLLLNIIYHEYVPVLAPPYVEADVIKRDKRGNPIRKEDKKKKITSIETERRKVIGSFIFKPHIYTLPPPTCNVLFPNMYDGIEYQRNFTNEITRMTMTPQVMEKSSLKILRLKVFKRPIELDTYFSIITSGSGTNSKITKRSAKAKYGDGQGQSARHQEWEFFTNEERFKGITPKFQKLAPAPAILSLSNQGKKDSKGATKGGVPQYIHNVASYEYFMNKFSSRQLRVSGLFNIRPVPGYPILALDDSDANMNMVAYLHGISHTLNASSGVSTSYNLVLPREVDEIDLNRPRLDNVTGFFDFAVENGERVFNFEKMFDSELQPPIPEWFDDSFKTVGKLTELYQSFFGPNVRSSEDTRVSALAIADVEKSSVKELSQRVYDATTNTLFRRAITYMLKDYETSKAANDEFGFVSAFTDRAFTTVTQAFGFLGAIAKNYTEDSGMPVADTDYIGSSKIRQFTKGEIDESGTSTDMSDSGRPIFNGMPIPHPFEMEIYNASVALAKKANEKATSGTKKRTITSAENAPTGDAVAGATSKPVSYPLSEDQILKARRAIINSYRNELNNKRGFRG